jgi:hypothetical protein
LSGQCPEPEDQLGEVERFGQVVVGAEPEAAHPVGGGVGRGEHEHHGRVIAASDHPADGVAVDAGQVSVQYDDVVAVDVQLGGGVEPGVGDVDGHALVSEALGDVVGQSPHVFDDQHPHGHPGFGRGGVA